MADSLETFTHDPSKRPRGLGKRACAAKLKGLTNLWSATLKTDNQIG